ncbi:MAG TPA: reductive dehalogenase domain-containing protein [Flavobacteriales bacterium]|nr:reductive dehalogenase domain-containing protein [Flavobacteriales bacterium]
MSTSSSVPAFSWDDWYESVGGRTIHIDEVERLLKEIKEDQYKRFDSEVNPVKHVFASNAEAAAHIKQKATEFGADLVGVCEIEPSDVYRGKVVTEKYAIALGQRMRWREFQVVPSRESAIECMRIYHSLGEVVIKLAAHIRSLGYACKIEHPIGDSDLLHVPIALKAGFGELGRHGSIINPKLGPLFRMGSIATSLPMQIDHPIDAGIAKFCDKCRACRIYCPAKAIPDERSAYAGKDHLGYDRYVVDTARCFPYFAKHNYCSICLPVCVYNHKEWAKDFEGFETKLFPEIIMEEPPPPADSVPEEKRHKYNKIGNR